MHQQSWQLQCNTMPRLVYQVSGIPLSCSTTPVQARWCHCASNLHPPGALLASCNCTPLTWQQAARCTHSIIPLHSQPSHLRRGSRAADATAARHKGRVSGSKAGRPQVTGRSQ